MTGADALLRFDAAAKAVKENDPRAEELISLCLPSDQNVLRERVKNSGAKTTEEIFNAAPGSVRLGAACSSKAEHG